MERLIDANIFDVICYTQKSSEFSEGVEFILDKIDNAPTIDAVPVVRCKDCESCEKEYTKELDVILHCGLKVALAHEKTIETSVFSNDFCSYGKRKEETK